ncbi:thioredoxin domain-containing protein [Hahella sp. CCB-MM4]|uniref:thioredoxin domain-containing protein n=1 Tax=Hahella sp. (strain CCB-MM4) TaxID=1926491 RepID=UPI000B9A7838|nr:DUF255 domain-containing protein [Hahella sp. CCB-MM4]OZG74472.1 thioredoxin domain-containing protein [Hahella sp. CCB-MM4]
MEDLRDIQRSKQGQYNIRTRHLDQDGQPLFTNHLIREQSPYLLQHAHNPVHWHPWNEETFALAKSRNLPVFLSIGYSTCHWCHVMEEQSFDDLEVAELLNRSFIPIKVDREQRPDLDEIYMTAVQIMTGQGGWPMSTFLTPEGHPFFGGTYFSKEQFIRLLGQISQLWNTENANLVEQGKRLAEAIDRYLTPPSSEASVGHDVIEAVRGQLLQTADKHHGGFGQAPKFPQEATLLFLLDQISRDDRPLPRIPEWDLIRQTLDNMLQGGIYDHIGGGFHRYSVDSAWQVPHFEKMLYNQAQLIRVYTQAYQICGDPEYRRVVSEIITYVLRDMRSEDGLFYSATDADSEGMEGRFFIWTYNEVKSLLNKEEWILARKAYGITGTGNFESANILHLTAPMATLAENLPLGHKTTESTTRYEQLIDKLQQIKTRLYEHRRLRVPPLTDTKIITEWNGMMIAALAEAARVMEVPSWLNEAVRAAEKLWQIHRQPNGLFWRLSMDRVGSDNALLEDYAHLIEGLLQIYDANHDHIWLERTEAMLTTLKEQYWDQNNGGFFVSSGDHQGPMLVRSKNLGDQATISGNSQMLSVLTALYRRTGDLQIQAITNEHIAAFAHSVSQYPMSCPYFLKGLAEVEQPNPTGLQYTTAGQIWAQAYKTERTDSGLWEVTLKIHLSEGWHIQTHQCRDPQGQSTQVRLLSENHHECLDIRYPSPEPWKTNDGKLLEIYSDQCEINLTLKVHHPAPVRLQLNLQACNETSCHQPHTLLFNLWL